MWQQKEEGIISYQNQVNHTTKFFTEYLLPIEMKKTEILFSTRHSILELSKIIMYEFWYDYVKTKLCFRFYVKTKFC